MLSPNARLAIVAKKNALRPKPDRGNAVAVPLCSGQLYVAAENCQTRQTYPHRAYRPVFMAAEKDVQLPIPVRKEQKLNTLRDTEPGPAVYAVSCVSHSYLRPERLLP